VKVIFHPSVFAEVDAIMRYYEDVAGNQLADDFYAEFRFHVHSAAETPELYNEREGGLRRVNLKRFPYNFLFRLKEDHIRILVIRHHARKEKYGIQRQ